MKNKIKGGYLKRIKKRKLQQLVSQDGNLDSPVFKRNRIEARQGMPVTQSRPHAIFCIDKSGSMRAKDVKGLKGPSTRWHAVFECAREFVNAQAAADGEVELLFSLILFSDDSTVVFEALPLGSDGGGTVCSQLAMAENMYRPSTGTCFSAGFRAVHHVAKSSTGPVYVVFLSDGRPGDLDGPIPKGDVIKRTFRHHGKSYPSAVVYLDMMRMEHGDRLSLQMVCIHDEGLPWLERLASQYNGVLRSATLSMDVHDFPVARSDLSDCPPSTTNIKEELKDEGAEVGSSAPLDVKEEQIDEGVKVKPSSSSISQERPTSKGDSHQDVLINVKVEPVSLIRQPSSKRLSLGPTTIRSSTMREAFLAMSQQFSSIRSTMVGTALVERAGRELETLDNPSQQVEYKATRMVLSDVQKKFVAGPREQPNARTVKLSKQPFAQGGLRNVFRLDEGSRSLVAKESRHELRYNERLAFHRETSACQSRAKHFAVEFNARARKVGLPAVDVLLAEVYRLADSAAPGGYRYLAVEERLQGEYEKFNSNNGYVLEKDPSGSEESYLRRTMLDLPQAFSHFTFELTLGKEIVVDIQGAGYTYTDPQLHSQSLKYGRADRGLDGMRDFFNSHKCNACCRALGLSADMKQFGLAPEPAGSSGNPTTFHMEPPPTQFMKAEGIASTTASSGEGSPGGTPDVSATPAQGEEDEDERALIQWLTPSVRGGS